jgi:hypothetical protein
MLNEDSSHIGNGGTSLYHPIKRAKDTAQIVCIRLNMVAHLINRFSHLLQNWFRITYRLIEVLGGFEERAHPHVSLASLSAYILTLS